MQRRPSSAARKPADAAQPPAAHSGPLPWAKLKSAAAGPQAFKRMLEAVDPKARPGDVVAVYDKAGQPYGIAFYNPKSLITLRLLARGGAATFDPDRFFGDKLARAIELRREVLGLDARTDAYRLVHDHGDGLPGVVIDRYADALVLEFYALGMFRQAERLQRLLSRHYPGARFVHRASEYSAKMEGFSVESGERRRTRVSENGVLFEVTPSAGYKTGFFCDQRENRLAFSALARERRVLDVCSYTGGFGIYAKKLGGAAEVTCVELDADAAELAKRNANINQAKVDVVNVDAFPYLRQAAANGQRFGLIVLDPYKLIANRETYEFGRKKYIDFNRLAISLLDEGGIILTCSCSGMLPWDEFAQIVRTAAGSAGRRLQVFRRSGAGPDHPVAVDYPEGEYLKALWCRTL